VRAARAAAVVLVLAAVSACGGGGSGGISADDASALVLHQADLHGPFASFASGPVAGLDTAGTPRADPERWGRKGGWIARFRRAGSATTRGPLVVESRVDVFSGSDGATKDLAAYRKTFEDTGGTARLIKAPALADGAVAMTAVQRGLNTVRFYTVAWRHGNATASVAVNGFDRRVTLSDAAALARRQDARIGKR
jgi:hypothetical protein